MSINLCGMEFGGKVFTCASKADGVTSFQCTGSAHVGGGCLICCCECHRVEQASPPSGVLIGWTPATSATSAPTPDQSATEWAAAGLPLELLAGLRDPAFVPPAHVADSLAWYALVLVRERDAARARVAELEAALRALVAWVNSDAVRGMSQVAFIHGYRIDKEHHEQGAPAWKLVNAALAAPRAGGEGGTDA